MKSRKNLLQREHWVRQMPGQPPSSSQLRGSGVAQTKMAIASPMKKLPVAPPVYRPHPIPKVLQTKSTQGQPSHSVQTPRQPVRPPGPRFEQRSIVQPKSMPVAQKPPVAPPVYRPEQKRIVQPKMAATIQAHTPPKAPPVYRPQAAPKVLQTHSSQQRAAAVSQKLQRPQHDCSSHAPFNTCSGTLQRRSGLLPSASTFRPATVHLKGKTAQVNPGHTSRMLNQTALRSGLHVVQRVINHQLTTVNSLKNQEGTYSSELKKMVKASEKLNRTVKYYDTLKPAEDLDAAKDSLWYVIKRVNDLQSEVDGILPFLAPTQNQSKDDKETYRVMVKFQDDLTKLSKAANDETAKILKITRAGAGNRPDANSESAIARTLAGLGLNNTESRFLTEFVSKQGGGWKEKREALTAIWAKRGNLFTTLKQGKGNTYNVDVEYQTTDVSKPLLWDQKTIFSDQTPFDGRLVHTHTKNKDVNERGVGLLFDSTFENESNYEKAWLGINRLLLSGEIAVDAVKEVRAPNLDALHSDLYVDMSQQYKSGSVEKNIMWAETNLANQKQGGYEVIAKEKVSSTNYSKVVDGTATTHSRYTNNRNWLPSGVVYNEYAVKGLLPDEGSGRFVATEDYSEIYLSVTHYKPYTVKLTNNKVVNRKAFFRII